MIDLVIRSNGRIVDKARERARRMKRASYREAVEWIAMNDDNAETDPEVVRYQVTVLLVADLFRLEAERVARDVLRYRAKHDTGGA